MLTIFVPISPTAISQPILTSIFLHGAFTVNIDANIAVKCKNEPRKLSFLKLCLMEQEAS
jgi:hypothetical protein